MSEGASTGRRDRPDVGERLTAACARHIEPGARVDSLRRLTGGASQETWSFDHVAKGGLRQSCILRRNTRSGLKKLSSESEYRLLEAAGEGGVPVPGVVFLLDDRDDLGPGYVMERIEGEALARKILRDEVYADARACMAQQAGSILARIHALDVSSIESIPGAEASGHPAQRAINELRGLIDQFGEPHPTFELALRWLEDERPDAQRTAIVHGDFRNGNFIVTSEGIASVLDWELAHIGDPIEDLGWLCVKSWRFGVSQKVVGGFGDVEDLCRAYREAGGRDVDPAAVHYWIVMGTLRWGVICQAQAFTHRSGMSRSLELAAIGHRICETEWDLLDAIG